MTAINRYSNRNGLEERNYDQCPRCDKLLCIMQEIVDMQLEPDQTRGAVLVDWLDMVTRMKQLAKKGLDQCQ